MACCALAAFLIGQFLLLWNRFRSAPADAGSAAAWRAGMPSPGPLRPIRLRRRLGLGLAMAGALGIAGVAVASTQPSRVELGSTRIYSSICGGEATSLLTRLWGRI